MCALVKCCISRKYCNDMNLSKSTLDNWREFKNRCLHMFSNTCENSLVSF